MTTVKFKNEINVTLNGVLPQTGIEAPNFKAVKGDLSEVSLSDFRGKKVVLNIFPSVDTGVCAASVRRFNMEAAAQENTVVLCVSKDLPFAQSRFCAAEGIENVVMLSAFRCDCFERAYGLMMQDGPLKGLLARAVVVIDAEGCIVYSELVPEITQEPSYEAALKAL
jgi:thiol peroxidase